MADKNFKVKNGLEVGDRDIVTPDGTITLPEGTGTLAKTSDVPSSEIVISEQTGTSYTLQQSDANKLLEFSNSSSVTVTVPLNSSVPLPVGTKIDVLQAGSGVVSINGISAGLVSPVDRTSSFNGTYNLREVAYGNGVWGIISNIGILTSTNLTSWTSIATNSNYGGYSIAYGNGLWIMGGYRNELRTSTDAVTWVTRTSNFPDQSFTYINSIAYGNNLWIIGGSGGRIRTSTDGITWTTRTSNFGNYSISSVAYGNGLWAAGAGFGQLRTSTDGVTWTTRTSNFGNTNIESVTYGNNIWMFIGSSSTAVTASANPSVTLNSKEGNTKLTGQWSAASLIKRGTDEWALIGDLSA